MAMMRNTMIRKIAALAMIFLLLFIHIVKCFDNHQALIYFSARDGRHSLDCNTFPNSHVTKIFHCPICDFQLLRDSDITRIEIPFVVQGTCDIYYSSSVPFRIQHNFSAPSGRAPPALI